MKLVLVHYAARPLQIETDGFDLEKEPQWNERLFPLCGKWSDMKFAATRSRRLSASGKQGGTVGRRADHADHLTPDFFRGDFLLLTPHYKEE